MEPEVDFKTKFEKSGRLSRGSYGILYGGRLGKRQFAIKRNIVDVEADFIASVRELSLLTEVKGHPSMVYLTKIYTGSPFIKGTAMSPVKDSMRRDDEVYFVFELAMMDLGSVKKWPSTKTRLRAMIDLLLGLEYLHAKNIIHRDIKPQNILVYPEEDEEALPEVPLIDTDELPDYPRVEGWIGDSDVALDLDHVCFRICDFGLSKHDFPGAPQTPQISTCWYRAPEVLLYPEWINSKIDIWSAGCVMVELFLGFNMFEQANDRDPEMALAYGEIFTDEIDKVPEYADNIMRILGVDQEIRDVNKWLHHLDLIRRRVASEEGSRTADQLIELIRQLLQVDPKRRISATEAINNSIFSRFQAHIDQVRRRFPPVPPPDHEIQIVSCRDRRIAVETILSAMFRVPDKIRSRMIFQALDIFDRFLVETLEGSHLGNNFKPNPDVIIFDSEIKARARALVCLYLSIKYFTIMIAPPKFSELIPDDIDRAWIYEYAEQFEFRLITSICNYKIYRRTPYELLDVHGEDALRLFRVYGSLGSEWNGIEMSKFACLYNSIYSQMTDLFDVYQPRIPRPINQMTVGSVFGSRFAPPTRGGMMPIQPVETTRRRGPPVRAGPAEYRYTMNRYQ